MQFTPPPATNHLIKIRIETSGDEHRVMIENAGNDIKTVIARFILAALGWKIEQTKSDAYAVGKQGAPYEAVVRLYEELRHEYGV